MTKSIVPEPQVYEDVALDAHNRVIYDHIRQMHVDPEDEVVRKPYRLAEMPDHLKPWEVYR